MLKNVTHSVEMADPFLWRRGGIDVIEYDNGAFTTPAMRQTLERTTEYKPLAEETGLFRTFAALEIPTGEDMTSYAAFAQTYGLLLARQPGNQRVVASDKAGARGWIAESTQPIVEEDRLWFPAHRELRWAVRLWDAVRHGSHQEVGLLLADPPVRIGYPDDTDETQRGAEALRLVVTHELSHGNVSPGIQWRGPRARAQGLGLTWRPHNLLGAMWLQLALAIDKAQEHRQCAACPRWFVIDPEYHRTNTRYCSRACQQREYRRGRQARSSERVSRL